MNKEKEILMNYTIYDYLGLFFLYAFLGWLLETTVAAVRKKHMVNRGFLNGPLCAIYGITAVFMTRYLYELQSSPVFLFLGCMIIATAAEWIAGHVLERIGHGKWWDYSNKPLNFHGYICLEFSLIWGVAILLVVKVFQSFVEHHTSAHAPSIVGWMVVAILYALYLADLIVTVAVIQGLNRKLTRLDTIRANMRVISDKISDSLATTTIDTVQKVGEGKVQAALARAEFKEATEEKVNKSIEMLRKNKADLQKEFDELSSSIVEHTFVGQGRLIKAFPDMKHRDYLEVVQELKNKMRDRK